MKILVLANAVNTLSGGDKRFIEIFRRLESNGHSIKVMLPKIGYNICRDENLNVTYQVLPVPSENRLGIILSNFLRTIIAIFVIMKNYGLYDVVYSTSDFINDTIPAMFLKLIDRKVKWVAVTHYLIQEPSKRDGDFLTNLIALFTQRISVKFMGASADLIITSTAFLKSQLVHLGIRENKIKVGSNGINIKLIDEIPENAKYYDACFAARLRPSKGIYDLLNIWEVVCKNKDANLVIVGHGEKTIIDELNQQIKQKGLLGKVELIGFRKSKDLYKIMKQSKLFLYLDNENGWGIAVAEAMCSKCVVVAYDLQVYREVFGDGILYVPLRNISKFGETITELLSNEDLVKKLGEQSRTIICKYDWDKIAFAEEINIKNIQNS